MNRGVNLNNIAEVKLFDVYGNCMGTAVPTSISVTLTGEISIECENLTTYIYASRPKIIGDASLHNRLYYGLVSYGDMYTNKPDKKPIEKVIFNDPATIVFWADGSKTVVKCQEHEVYDPEKGLAMATAKKAFGNEGNYYNIFKEWLPEEAMEKPVYLNATELSRRINEAARRMAKGLSDK